MRRFLDELKDFSKENIMLHSPKGGVILRKKHSTTVKLLCTCLTFLLVFTGCTVNPESIEMMDSTNYNPKEDNVVSEIPARYDLLDHIEMSFDENHFVDADVYAPQSTMATNYILEPLEITLETGASIFFPGDNSSSSIETIDGISKELLYQFIKGNCGGMSD